MSLEFKNISRESTNIILFDPIQKKEFSISKKKLDKIFEKIKQVENCRSLVLYHSIEKTKLPRRLLVVTINEKATALLLLNKKREGDRLVGQGSNKLVKFALGLDGSLFVSQRLLETPFLKPFIKHEIDNLKLLKDEKGFVKMLATVSYKSKSKGIEKDKVRIIQEYYSEGTFDSKKIKNPENISIIYQIAKSLDILHNKYNCVHRDLKHAQIFLKPVTEEETKIHRGLFTAYIGDLGSMCTIGNKNWGKGFFTTPWFTSPELAKVYYPICLEASKSSQTPVYPTSLELIAFTTPAQDLWSLGVIIYLSLTQKKLPWCKSANTTLRQLSLMAGKWHIFSSDGKNNALGFDQKEFLDLSKLQQELIRMLLVVELEKRASAAQVIDFIEKHFDDLQK